jgi:hypothetical protein
MYMQDGKMMFYKPFDLLQLETGENKLSKAIATVMQQSQLNDAL